MTTKDLAKLIGRTAVLETEMGLRVRVSILDAKIAWGWTRVEVTPTDGTGSAWVDVSRTRLEDLQ